LYVNGFIFLEQPPSKVSIFLQNVIYYAFVSTNREKIDRAIRKALASPKEGLIYSELVRYIKEKHPGIKENTIHGALLYVPQRMFKQTQTKTPGYF